MLGYGEAATARAFARMVSSLPQVSGLDSSAPTLRSNSPMNSLMSASNSSTSASWTIASGSRLTATGRGRGRYFQPRPI